jgi:hypothetical protein
MAWEPITKDTKLGKGDVIRQPLPNGKFREFTIVAPIGKEAYKISCSRISLGELLIVGLRDVFIKGCFKKKIPIENEGTFRKD